VETLSLAHNLISSLGQGALSNFSHLTTVKLNNNKIMDIQRSAFTNLPQLTDLDLKNNLIRDIRPFAFQDLPLLMNVDLTNNYIASLHVDVFAEVGTLKQLHLGANSMTSVPDLRHLTQLLKLDLNANLISNATFPPKSTHLAALNSIVLSNNKIAQLTNGTFEALRNSSVRKLELSRNRLKNVSTGALKPLVALQSLKIGNNPLDGPQLQHVLQGLRDDTNLESLDIRNISLGGTLPSLSFSILSKTPLRTLIFKTNMVQTIPRNAFSNLHNLKQLELSQCHIQHVDRAAFVDLPELQLLFLNDNDLTDVPANLPASLLTLYLQTNKISMLKNGVFGNLTNLTLLNISNNHMTSAQSNSFLGLRNLQCLYLCNNKLDNIPTELFEPLTSLTNLSLRNNHLRNLKGAGSMSDLVNLQNLDLSYNECNYLPYDYLSGLSSLLVLNLNNNQLGLMMANDQHGTFLRGLSKLETLNMMYNNLYSIPDAEFRYLSELQHLNLRHNQLSSWGPNLFKTAASTLQTLDLSYNQVALVNTTSVQDLSHVTSLNLSMNPFACTCDLVWFCEWINKTSVQLVDVTHYKCNSPSEWNHKPLVTFCDAHIDCRDYMWFYVGGAAGGTCLMMIILSVFVYRQRWFIRLRFYRLQKRIGRACLRGNAGMAGYAEVQGNARMYDFYIIASEADSEFVQQELLFKLDNQFADEEQVEGDAAINRFKLYFEERDANPGKNRIKNWEDDMPACSAALVVLTRNLNDDAWCKFLLEQAEELRIAGEIDRIQIVKVGSVPPRYIPKRLHGAVERRDYFEWPNRDRVEQDFVEKLREVLQEGQEPPARHIQHV
ncbi:hypothetical protein BaRGS_00008527, partial [Batillaria attramentaria]